MALHKDDIQQEIAGPDPARLRADGSERVRYDYPTFFSYIREGRLSSYPHMRAECHWHDDWEFLIVRRGHLTYFVDGERVRIEEGQGIFVNARRLHYGYSEDGTDCEFLCVLVNQMRVGAMKDVLERFILPIGGADSPPYLLLDDGDAYSYAHTVLESLGAMAATQDEYDAPLAVLSGFYAITRALNGMMKQTAYAHNDVSDAEANRPSTGISADRHAPAAHPVHRRTGSRLTALTAMVDFIQASYARPLTLDMIASAGAVSRSTCSAIFRDYLCQSPIDYVTDVRLRAATELLETTDLPVSAVAARCGFNSANYFTRVFRITLGVAPLAYRKRQNP